MPQSFIPLCIPEIRGNEWKYIKECLDTNWVSSVGAYVNRFESMVADYVGANHGVATVNGTSALHTALLVTGVEPDDEVLVSTLTFIAPANAIRYAGAWPIFIDSEPEYWQMSPREVVDFLEQGCDFKDGEVRNKHTGRRVKAIMPVHILGHPVDMEPILAVARKYNLLVIEDATESLGAKYKGHRVGHLGDIACFSFNGNKILTTGGGGMIVTDNEAWASKAKYLTTQAKDNPVEYIHHEIGYNYRLTNLQAAMGCAQMENLEEYIAAKRRIAATYSEAFAEVPGLTPMVEATWASSIFWMYTLLVDESQYGQDSRQLLRRLQEAKIQTRPLWEPLHCSLAHTQDQPRESLAVAEKLNQQALSLPCSVGLSVTDQQRVIEFILKEKQ
ncbi:LegC family aminotransferase [Moorena sp. SIO3A2]|uniref:LegC family aminotransferase n=1 Tax=Moorena sp. SIO3A2 TaxID=2607841 RepID=UPI0013B6D0BA|nr:LegC family aminotransferase [Moorena sp. SIO3A2]NER87926.1 LegC family aminotransferase [Moorena sp. SIO3A2]